MVSAVVTAVSRDINPGNPNRVPPSPWSSWRKPMSEITQAAPYLAHGVIVVLPQNCQVNIREHHMGRFVLVPGDFGAMPVHLLKVADQSAVFEYIVMIIFGKLIIITRSWPGSTTSSQSVFPAIENWRTLMILGNPIAIGDVGLDPFNLRPQIPEPEDLAGAFFELQGTQRRCIYNTLKSSPGEM